ncbi:MAG: hypothetical protein OQJ76_01285 [Rhodospirillales bacterium]|nr:hypothetical protein [Rhodospirillales bacterium]
MDGKPEADLMALGPAPTVRLRGTPPRWPSDHGLSPYAGPYRIGSLPPVWLARVRPAADIKSRAAQARRLTAVLRDVFGYGPPVDKGSWGEYLCCEEGHRTSIEDAYRTAHYIPLVELERDGLDLPAYCARPGCDRPLSFCHDPAELTAKIIRRMSDAGNFFATAVVDAEARLHGFCYGWIDDIASVWDALAHFYKRSETDLGQFVQAVGESTGGALRPTTPVLLIAEVGVTLPYRDEDLFIGLAHGFFNAVPDPLGTFPALAACEPDKRSYMYLQASGYDPVFSVPESDVIVQAGLVRGALSLWSQPAREIHRRCMDAIAEWKLRAGGGGSAP